VSALVLLAELDYLILQLHNRNIEELLPTSNGEGIVQPSPQTPHCQSSLRIYGRAKYRLATTLGESDIAAHDGIWQPGQD